MLWCSFELFIYVLEDTVLPQKETAIISMLLMTNDKESEGNCECFIVNCLRLIQTNLKQSSSFLLYRQEALLENLNYAIV